MLSQFSGHTFDSASAIPRHVHRTPGPTKRVFDQNAAVVQTTGRKNAKNVVVPYTPARGNGGKDGVMTTAKKAASIRQGGALLDKTPAPNRQMPSQLQADTPLATKIAKPIFAPPPNIISSIHLTPEAPDEGPVSPLPSSTRKKLKVPSSASKLFLVTPPGATSGGWDVSDGSISVANTMSAEEASMILEEDTSEPEYMPPTAIEDKWEPDFEMPDFKALGEGLANFQPLDSVEEYDPEDYVDDANLLKLSGWKPLDQWERIPLPHVEDNDDSPFGKPAKQVQVKTNAKPSTTRPTVGRPVASKTKFPTRPQTQRPAPNLSRNASSRAPVHAIRAQPKTDFGLGLREEDLEDAF